MSAKSVIVNLLRREYERAQDNYRTAIAEHAGAIAFANAWDQYNSDDGVGGMSQNPYRIGQAEEREVAARNYLATIRDAYNLSVDTFVE